MANSTSKFAVIGMGQFGRAIVRKLTQRGAEVLAIDTDEQIIDDIAEEVAYAVALDATDPKALASQNISDYDAVVIAIGNNFEQLTLCAVTLLELETKRIIARATGTVQKTILEKIGIREVLIPESEVATIVTEKLLNPSIVSYLELPDDYRIAELKPPEVAIGRTVGDLALRDRYNLSLITITKELEVIKNGRVILEEHIDIPNSSTEIGEDDFMLIFGKQVDIERFLEINE
ncbi:TrkA family potassium uptake protein [Prolixibacter sp. NT017]|uniref:potassium channel family protein n=1 Tax=Prolixibacter sp. NT017 TaxID=2652390 RepID=UPI00126E9937|nr:TrkA family potassium uptake protein [Prolixibacter sp. NT017]GET25755.1 hypothetical protein NT017_20840 [Prolixibacter sp. NT017]